MLSDNIQPIQATTTRQLYALDFFLVFSLFAYTLSIRSLSPAPPSMPLVRYTKVIHSRKAAQIYERQPSCSSSRASIESDQVQSKSYRSSFPIPLITCVLASVSVIVWWNRCPRDLGRSHSTSFPSPSPSLPSLATLSLCRNYLGYRGTRE